MDFETREKVFKERIATVFNLGAVKLNTDTKKIQVQGDDFTLQKNLYGDKKATPEERNAKVNSLYDIAEILSDSKFVGKEIEPSFENSEVKPKNKAHKDVKYWYKFKNTISMDGEIYDVTFSIRDKGKSQYQYLIDFHKKGDNSNQPYGHKDLRRAIDESSPKNRVSQNEGSVNTQSMQEGKIYSQGKEVIIPEKARVAKNIILDEESSAFRTKNGKGYKVIEMMAQDHRKKVKFVKGLTDEDGNVLDGVITEKGIIINTEGKNPVKWAATHEISHRMKQSAEKAWAKYQQYVVKATKKDGTYNERFNLKAKAYKTTDEAYINEEIAADYIGELFDDVDSLADFIRESRSDAVGVRNFWYNILDRLGIHGEKRKAQALWSKAYKKAMQSIEDGKVGKYEGETKFKIDESVNFSGENSDKTELLEIIRENFDEIQASDESFNVSSNEIKSNNIASMGIYEYFLSIGGIATSPQIGVVELNKKGAKTTTFHGIGKEKYYATVAVKPVIEKGKIVHAEKNWKNRGYDSYIFMGKGKIDGKDTVVGVIVKSYPKSNLNNKFYLHEAVKIGVNSDTAVENNATRVNESTPTNNNLSQDVPVVNTYSMQDGGNYPKKSVTGTRLDDVEGEILREAQNDSVEELARENEELKKQLENIHIQLNQAEGRGPDVKEIKKAAQKIRTAYSSKIGVAELHRELTKLYTYMSGNNVNPEEVSKRISTLAGKVIENATERIDIGSEYTDLLDRIRTTRIQVPESERADFKDGYESFRKSNMGKLRDQLVTICSCTLYSFFTLLLTFSVSGIIIT